jgi:imidazole glycerol-phosphate synthase subunit HisH
MRVVIVDYGAGNLRSVSRAFTEAGATSEIITAPSGLAGADAIVVPGVGAFAPAMRRIEAAGLVQPLRDAARNRVPVIGICLGMQLFFERSEEGGTTPGLGLFAGAVTRLPPGVKIPHMGWNVLVVRTPDPVFADLPPDPYAYFVHSYVVNSADPAIVLATTNHGTSFPSLVRAENIWGLQFHPEKSGAVGARMLRNLMSEVRTAVS